MPLVVVPARAGLNGRPFRRSEFPVILQPCGQLMPRINRPHADVSRWRRGIRDIAARLAHNADTTSWRRSIAEAVFDADDQAHVLEELRRGARVTEAAAAVGLAVNALYGRAEWDADFADRLEETLANTCPAGDYCGRPAGVKHGGHRRACRRAQHPPKRRSR
jgi:hypothetical protein